MRVSPLRRFAVRVRALFLQDGMLRLRRFAVPRKFPLVWVTSFQKLSCAVLNTHTSLITTPRREASLCAIPIAPERPVGRTRRRHY